MNDIETDSAREDRLDRDLRLLRAQRQEAPAHLHQRIIATLPEREPALELLDWLGASAWRPITAAVLPLVVGFAVGMMIGGDELSYPDSILFADVWEAYESNEI